MKNYSYLMRRITLGLTVLALTAPLALVSNPALAGSVTGFKAKPTASHEKRDDRRVDRREDHHDGRRDDRRDDRRDERRPDWNDRWNDRRNDRGNGRGYDRDHGWNNGRDNWGNDGRGHCEDNNNRYEVISGIVLEDLRGDTFYLRTRFGTLRVTNSSQRRWVSRGDYVRISGTYSRGVFQARDVDIIRDR